MTAQEDPAACVVLVPTGRGLHPRCDQALTVLEARGYHVRRVHGFAAIDVARSLLATQALTDGFGELLWIDSDIVFDPDDVDRLRAHDRPFTCGLYPIKGRRAFATQYEPRTEVVTFGVRGGLIDVRFVGMGFVHTRREVYETIAEQPEMQGCEIDGEPVTPYFLPMLLPLPGGRQRYVGEDYAFCERVRRAGFTIEADTRIRLWHVGRYAYGWEDAGRDIERFTDYTWWAPDQGFQVARDFEGDG